MDYDNLADIVGKEMLEYKVKNESFPKLYEICLKKHGTFTEQEKNTILIKVIHTITILGYDIDSTHPCRFKRYLD